MVRFALVVGLILGAVLGGSGCKTPSPSPDPSVEGVKIPDLAAPSRDRPPPPQFLMTVALDVHVLELPADNVDKLRDVWQVLSASPIRLSSYNAFSENSFRLLYGKIVLWERIRRLLTDADAQAITTVSLTVPDNDKTDLPIAEIPAARPITFVAKSLAKETVDVGSGILALRLWAQRSPWGPNVRRIIGCPTYLVPTGTPIPELQAQARKQDFPFESAAFACEMRPGDLLVLGPEKYTGERASLGGLFFNKSGETLFFNADKPKLPERRPAVRVYVLVCTQVSG
jgi:hypothetical protein